MAGWSNRRLQDYGNGVSAPTLRIQSKNNYDAIIYHSNIIYSLKTTVNATT